MLNLFHRINVGSPTAPKLSVWAQSILLGYPNRNAQAILDHLKGRNRTKALSDDASVRHAEEMKSRSFETNPTSDKVDCVRLKLISDDGVFELR